MVSLQQLTRPINNFDSAKDHLKNISYPTVVKADGLAGKGVIICQTEK